MNDELPRAVEVLLLGENLPTRHLDLSTPNDLPRMPSIQALAFRYNIKGWINCITCTVTSISIIMIHPNDH